MNMNYCIFENTNLAMKQAAEKLDDVINGLDIQLSTDEARAMVWLVATAIDIIKVAQQCTARPILHDEFDLQMLLANIRPYADASSRGAQEPHDAYIIE